MGDARRHDIDELLANAKTDLEQEYADYDPEAATRRLMERIEREDGMDSNALDRHITGNWGEDSVPGDFIMADRLPHLPVGTRIDVSKDTYSVDIVATVERATITSGFVHVTAEEYDCVMVFPVDATIRLADD